MNKRRVSSEELQAQADTAHDNVAELKIIATRLTEAEALLRRLRDFVAADMRPEARDCEPEVVIDAYFAKYGE